MLQSRDTSGSFTITGGDEADNFQRCHYSTKGQWGNSAPYKGGFITDLALLQRGDISDGLRFCELYRIPYENAEPYQESKTMVAIMNERATIVANPGRSCKKWDHKRQRQFEIRIWNFNNKSMSFCSRSLEWRDQRKGQARSQSQISFELDATELCTEVFRGELSPVRNGLRDLRKDNKDCDRTGGPLGNLKCAAANPSDVAGGVVPANGFGSSKSPLASPAEQNKGEAIAKSKETETSLDNGKQGFIDALDPGIAQDQGYNLSGPVFPTVRGAIQDPGRPYSQASRAGWVSTAGHGILHS
ncbi:hypothetical protein HOY82DRAFT_630879 [Tuber indicum]|nr:hypothetical protein HOY82DRAFT_630879 [Tuber indicum]